MKSFMLNGKKEKIPPFPHHKEYVYRIKQFFRPRNILTPLTMFRFIALKEVIRGYRHRCAVPRELLIDPTSSCNLRCKGCWAADYEKGDHLSYAKLDELMVQAEELGICDIVMSGGEPLMRKDDILRLCRGHRKLTFSAFTNATLIDAAFADQVAEVGNFTLSISIEGTKEETDFRRGDGIYDKALEAMRLLRDRDIGFAFSACYHSKNYRTIASDEFLDDMRRRGCWFGWLFNYVPVGKGADLSLVCTPEQRAYVMRRISDYCDRHDYTIIDFWNTGHLAYGCVAAGSGFVHINARGDVEPCAFCHYSDSNINDMTLLEALKSPFLTKFRASQPFSGNPLRACPMVDVPEAFVSIASQTGARSTHYSAPETAEDFAAKTRPTAEKWQPVADALSKELGSKKRFVYRNSEKFLSFRRKVTDGRR